MKSFFISIPHSGERVPPETPWLHGLPEPLLMCDVDRFVDRLYQPAIDELKIPSIIAQWHRYVVDLNRLEEDIDAGSVQGSANPPGTFSRGLHWTITTKGEKLMSVPMSFELHEQLVERYYDPFHAAVRAQIAELKAKGASEVYHLDAHSMPSVGTSEHRDPGQKRADVVVSDCHGKSCSAEYRDLVIDAYKSVGFSVSYNWPYFGGRVTEVYGHPEQGQHSIQVELNRALYMDEVTKKWIQDQASSVQKMLHEAVSKVVDALP